MNRIILNAIFPGEPTTWKRASACGIRRFTSERMRQAQTKLRWELKAVAPNLKPNAEQRFGIQAIYYISRRGDGDNFEKLVWDALQGSIWEDDEQIDEWQGKKVLGKVEPRIHLIVYVIE